MPEKMIVLPRGNLWVPPNGEPASVFWTGTNAKATSVHAEAGVLAARQGDVEGARRTELFASIRHAANHGDDSTSSAPDLRGYTADPYKRPMQGWSGHKAGKVDRAIVGEERGSGQLRSTYLGPSYLRPIPGYSGWMPNSQIPFGASTSRLQDSFASGRPFHDEGDPRAQRMRLSETVLSRAPLEREYSTPRVIPKRDFYFTGLSKRTPTGRYFTS